MLKRLYIENFALVEKLEIEFEPGMNVLTGETGAGKSIIVGAIGRLLGEKADQDDIRSGAKLAAVEGDFDISSLRTIGKSLESLDIENDARLITLRREIVLNKTSRCFINGRLVTLSQLRDITKYLAELFGQHSHQQLLDEENHRAFLDRFAGLTDEVNELRQVYDNWQSTKQVLIRLENRRETERNERELLLFQKEEIEKARIHPGEEEEIIAEKKILDSSQILGEKASLLLQMIDRDDKAALNVMGSCRKELSAMTALDKSLEKEAELLGQAIINLEEFRSQIETYVSSIPDDPDRLEQINLRLDELYRLKKKYGGSEQSILITLEKIKEQLSRGIDIDDRIKILTAEEKQFFDDYRRLAHIISAKREIASNRLSGIVEKELKQVGIDSAKFQYEFIYESDPEGIELGDKRVKPLPEGLETGRFMISANPGEPLKPLAKTASGGEISRIMLALKAADRQKKEKHKTLLVFDEIDSGIGGETANKVAGRLANLAGDSQLLVITHLHQIASVSDHHYAVEKSDIKGNSGRKTVSIRKLNQADRKKEIQRMLSLPEEIEV